MKNCFIIKSDGSLQESANGLALQIETFCEKAGLDYVIVFTAFAGEEEEVVRRLAADYPNRILRMIVCGDLESLHFAVNGVYGVPNVELGFYTTTPNAFYLNDVSYLVQLDGCDIGSLITGHSMDVDLLKINDRYCINGIGIGLDIESMKLASKIGVLSKRFQCRFVNNKRLLKFLQFCQALFHTSCDNIAVHINGYETIRKPMSSLFLANTKSYHFGFTAASDVEIDNGLIYLLLISEIPTYLLYYYYGLCILRNMDMNLSEVSNELVTLRRCLDVEIKSEQPIRVSLDSAVYMVEKDFHIQVVPAAIRMLLPY